MSKKPASKFIRLRGVRQNNLKNFDLDLPLRKLIVITGLSGSGKSSLAFDTLFAEGQRRYIETFSPYARQFFDRMDKPRVDHIEGIPPAIAIEQRNTVKTTRSTVGTMTEICDYAKLAWAHLAQLYCRNCGEPVRKETPQVIWQILQSPPPSFSSSNASKGNAEDDDENEGRGRFSEILITFELPLSEKLSLEESLALISNQGYQRLLLEGRIIRLDEALVSLRSARPASLTVIQDRLKPAPSNRARFVEAGEQAYHFGKGRLALRPMDNAELIGQALFFSNRFHCARCDINYREPSPALFSFNHPLGACPTCRGFGRTITIDYDIAIPDRSKTLAEGAVKPWQTGHGVESQEDLLKFCKKRRVPANVPFRDLPKALQDWVIDGDPDYGKDAGHEWPRAWYGVKGYFRWLESKAYKMHVRVLLSRYRAYETCPACRGTRFQPDALLFKVDRVALPDFYRLPIRDALRFVAGMMARRGRTKSAHDPLTLAMKEIHGRLAYLEEVGLGYLTLDRATRTLSGGETERVNLTTCLGSGLVNTLFVLDEPTVGLHPRDTARLVRITQRLRDAGNTVVVVEHESAVMRAADEVIDLGPGHGESGGKVVFQGPFRRLLASRKSLTGQYLSGRKCIEIPQRRDIQAERASPGKGRRDAHPALTLHGAARHNLKNLTVEIPLGRFVCLTGVSGSGKTTLVREVLLPRLEASLASNLDPRTSSFDPHPSTLSGAHHLQRVLLVDQSPLGRTPRSNPAVYTGAFDHIRELFARTEPARQRGLKTSAFSFNSAQGQCERCRGAGFEKIEMQFLSDVFIRCPDCDGRRYRAHILEIKLEGRGKPPMPNGRRQMVRWSIADLLEATVDEAIGFLSGFADSPHAARAVANLKILQEVGLGYLRLGQPINTLSGGESQRLKLAAHLGALGNPKSDGAASPTRPSEFSPALFLFDEPTTGLHFDDIRQLVQVFQRLVDSGHSVLVIEHNVDLIKCADWIIDLGPEAGEDGGRVVAAGTPEQVAAIRESHTGAALRPVLAPRL